MSDQTIRLIVPLVLLLHGIGHVMGILTATPAIKTDIRHS